VDEPRTGDVGRPAVWRGLALVSTAGIVWGTIGPGVRLVHDGSRLDPLTISAYRSIVAVAVLFVVCLGRRRLTACWVSARRHWRQVALVGTLTAIFQMLFFIAVVLTGVSVTTVVSLGLAPLLLLVLESVRRRRPPSTGKAVTIALAVIGLALVSITSSPVSGSGDRTLGVLAALGSGAAYALSAQAAAPLTRELDTMSMTTATTTVAATVLVPCGLAATVIRGAPLGISDARSWLLIAYLGAVTMAAAYALLYAGLRHTPSGTAVVATLLEPVTALAIAVLFLDEHLTATGAAGSLLILAAIASLGWRADEVSPQ